MAQGQRSECAERCADKLRKIVPADGTSLENAFIAMNALNPEAGQRDPDHRRPADAGRERAAAARRPSTATIASKLFERAIAKYPQAPCRST